MAERIRPVILHNYRRLAEERIRRLHYPKTCTIPSHIIAQLEYKHGPGHDRVNWSQADQPRIVNSIVDCIVTLMLSSTTD